MRLTPHTLRHPFRLPPICWRAARTGRSTGGWPFTVGALAAVVHLAGDDIDQRWTAVAEARILTSRVNAAQLLMTSVKMRDGKQEGRGFILNSAIELQISADEHR